MKWTHLGEILAINSESRTMRVRFLEDHNGPINPPIIREMEYGQLFIIEGLEGQKVLLNIDPEEAWINQIHPGKTSVDAVSLSIMKMLVYPYQSLREAWLETSVISPRKIWPCIRKGTPAPSSEIIYTGRRFHWEGISKGVNFETNEVSFEGETPSAILASIRLKPLREIVDHPAIPKHAVATYAWNKNGFTRIAYDVEDVDMEKEFGAISRLALRYVK